MKELMAWLSGQIDQSSITTECREAHRGLLNLIAVELVDDAEDQTAQLMLQTLAIYYRNHPGYREEWKPDYLDLRVFS